MCSTLEGMRESGRLAVMLALVCVGAPSLLAAQNEAETPGGEPELEAALLRTWAADDVTMVDGLAHVPLSMLSGSVAGTYRFELSVYGDDGIQLYRDAWERPVSKRTAAYAGVESSTLLESFRFGVKPGTYNVELRAYPTDAADLGTSRRLSVEGFEERPLASDLFLADHGEPLDDEGGGSWSITHGGFGFAAVARTGILPAEPTVFYYVELYGDPATETSVDVSATVVSSSGRAIYETPPATVAVTPGGVPYAGNLSLAGLPPGEYELRLEIADPDGGEIAIRGAPFRMLERGVGADRQIESEEGRYFASLSEAELMDTFGGVAYVVSEGERQAYEALPLEGKRRYLTEFFMRRDPTPGTPENSFLEEYIERIQNVRMKYGELVGTRERPPWMTDAGRIYLRFGEPDQREINHYPSGADLRPVGGTAGLQGEIPYEIWGYHSTGFVYLFVQESQFGVWRMIFTTDPNMSILADWANRVGPGALRDMSSKFGVRPR